MNLLDVFFIISGVVIFLLGVDVAKKKKFNALHFFVFLSIGLGLLIFTLFPEILTKIGGMFGLQRGADLLVYLAIIFLIYFTLLLLRKIEDNSDDLTMLVRQIAIMNAPTPKFTAGEIFLIPAYNEGQVIHSTIKTILDSGYSNIVVVNDGSSDDTLSQIEKVSSEIIVISHLKNRGQGAALETGFMYLRKHTTPSDIIVTFDADGQHDIADIDRFRKELEPGIDILLGSRFLSESRTNISLGKKIFLKLAIIFTFFLSSIKLSDTHNGYRYIRAQALKDLSITIDGMGHASEIIDCIAVKGLRYKEVPVHIKYTEYSLKKGQRIGNAINIFWGLIWNKFFR